jgi:uncharacterized protein (DUF486 family)
MTQLGPLVPILLLTLSNVFMTFAWYGHLKAPHMALWIAILVSWGLAFVEYCFAVPANRIGHKFFSLAELKTIQEVITLTVFVLIAVVFFGEKFTLQHIFGFLLIAAGAALIFNVKKAV